MRCITWPLVRGSKITTRMKFSTLFAYSLCHFYASTVTIKRCSNGSIPIVKRFQSRQKSKMALIWGNGGLDVRFYVRDPKKAHPWVERRVLAYFASKIRPGPLAVASCKNPPKKLTRFWCTKSRMRWDETPGRIVTNFCTCVGVHDVITCADLYYDRLRGLGVAGGQILAFSIDLLSRPYNTFALPCEYVICCFGLGFTSA